MLDKLKDIASWALSGSSMAVYVICVGVGAAAGWHFTSEYYTNKIDSIRADLASAAQKEISDYATRLSQTTDQLVVANNHIRDLSAVNESLSHRLLDLDAREDARVKANPGKSYEAEYTACRKLLSEGSGLLAEGSELALRIATEKDALATLAK